MIRQFRRCLMRAAHPAKVVGRDGEKRADGSESKLIRGYGAVYYVPGDPTTEYWLWDDMVERIKPGAFDRIIAENQDVRCLFNHDSNYVLGRTVAGTCRLKVDAVGLYYEADEASSDPQWMSVAAKIARGDVTGSSFSFWPAKVMWESVNDGERKYDIRWITEMLIVWDVGPVTFPAYEGTSSSRNVVTDELDSLRMERNSQLIQGFDDDVAVRRRIAELHS